MKHIVDCSTGEHRIEEFTTEEIAEMEAEAVRQEAVRAAEAVVATELAAHKASGEAKLAELGLSADEIAALTS
tara:strand:+ start:142 stop:360 length:219 start_codon:yes stop_codon:yes gene_type:complete